MDFETSEGHKLRVYTTRPDTLFGATYMVIAPEHPYVKKWADQITNYDAVETYVAEAARKSDFERTELVKDKTGVKLEGVYAINPVNGKHIPIFISDYVLSTYGTGAIMAVPAHDDRDFAFAKKFGCDIIQVVAGGDITDGAFTAKDDSATLMNSDFLNGLTVREAIPAMTKWLEEKGIGEGKVNYKLRDWVFSRQRYWGEPIPIVHCPKCGTVPLPESELPLVLPEVESYEPTDDGESPLAPMTDWVSCKCPKCGGDAKRETDTMPQWAGSSWYFLRYMDPHNDKALASKEALDYWGQVDWYNGGMEHTTLHLLYSRFWNNFLHDIGVVPNAEPYAKRTSHGMILGKNPHYVGNVETQEEKDALIHKYGNQALRPAVKMSKSLGNVVNPDDVIKAYGADTMRLYILFIGDFEKTATWSDDAVKGCKRFLDKVWNLGEAVTDNETEISKKNEIAINKAIKKVGEDIDTLKANTAIATLMSLVNNFNAGGCNKAELKVLLTLLCPFAPHICEEIWEQHGFEGLCSLAQWPSYDPKKTVDAEIDMAIQVNGKFRGTMRIAADVDKDTAIAAALETDIVKRQLANLGGEVRKTIVVPGKLINLIIK